MARNVKIRLEYLFERLRTRRSESMHKGDPCARYQTDLTAYADGEIDPASKQAIEGHLSVCPCCRANLSAVHLVGTALMARTQEALSPAMSARLRMALADVKQKPARMPLFVLPRPVYAVASLAAVAAVLMLGHHNIRHDASHVQVALGVSQSRSDTPLQVPSAAPASPTVITSISSSVSTQPVSHPSQNLPAASRVRPIQVVSPAHTARHEIVIESINRAVRSTHPAAVGIAAQPVMLANQSGAAQDNTAPNVVPNVVAPVEKMPEQAAQVAAQPDDQDHNVNRAPDNTIARMPDQSQLVAYEIGGNEPTSLGHRLHNTGQSMARSVVYLHSAHVRVGDGTANVVDAGFR